MAFFIDTHSHMYADAFDQDRDQCMKRAFDQNVKYTLLPNIDSSSIPALRSMVSKYPNQAKGMMGLHPTSVKENYREELELIKAELDVADYIAVGEIGIDLYWDKTFLREQIDAFATQIEWAKRKHLPIAIHARDSFSEIFEVLDSMADENLSGVFHCFTGDLQQAQKALGYSNFYLGIGGVITFKNGGLDKVIPEIGIERLVLETDAPYLSPVPFRGKRNETAYTVLVAEKLAEIAGKTMDEIGDQTTLNAQKLFGLS